MFFLVMSAILIDIQYQGNLCDIRSDMLRLIDTYEEGVKLSDILIQKFGGAYYSAEYKKIYSLMFDYQYCHPQHSLEKYTQLLTALEQQIKSQGDQYCLIFLFQLLVQNNSVNNKNIKLIIDTGIAAKKESFRAAMNILHKEFQLLSKAVKDHIFFYNGRQLFYEIYSFIKFFGGPDKSELFSQIFIINELLFEKQFLIFSSSLHYSLTMRNRSEMYEKGLGVAMNLTLALDSINKELAMRKENDNLFAYANYVAAKLKRKLQSSYSEQQSNEHFEKSWNQFTSRLNNDANKSNISKLVYLYYLARISKLWRQNYLDTQNKYKEALGLYLRERHVYKNSKTLQFEIICIKIEKKTNSQGQASLYYGHGILSPQNALQAGAQGAGQGQFFSNNNNVILSQGINQNQPILNNQMNTSKINGQDPMHMNNGMQNTVGLNHSVHNSQGINQMQGQSINNNNNNLMQQSNLMQSNHPIIQQQSNLHQQQVPLMQQQSQQQSNFQQQQAQPQLMNQQSQLLQNSAGLNGMANSNIRNNMSNSNPFDNQVQNSQRIGPQNQQNSTIPQQLIGSTNFNAHQNTITDRQNYIDSQQNEMQYSSANRNTNNNYKASVSPNNRNLQSVQTGFQNTTPNVDIIGLGTNLNNNRNLQSNFANPQNSSNNNNNYTNNIPSSQSLGNNMVITNNLPIVNNNKSNQIASFNSLLHIGQTSPYGKGSHQSIFGNQTPTSKFLNSGFQNHMINRVMQEKLSALKQKRTFLEPQNIVIMDFLHRGGNYTTSEAVIIGKPKQNMPTTNSSSTKSLPNNDVNIVSADKLSKLRSYKKHMNVSVDDQQILDGEPVVVKQFIVSDCRVLDDMFGFIEMQEKKLIQQCTNLNLKSQSQDVNSIVYQQNIAQVFQYYHLIHVKAFSYLPISTDAIALFLFYPAQSYNLYGAIKKNLFSLLDKMLIASQICDSVHNLHASSIFHLNLKPSNILFDSKKSPYLSGWEIKRKEITPNAEENLDEEELDERMEINYGYTAPEVVNSFNDRQKQIIQSNTNRSATPPRNVSQFNQPQQPQFGNLNIHSSKNGVNQQFGPRSDIWSLGMILHYLFFRIDSGEGTFCRDKRVYGGFNLIITEYAIGSNYFLDKVKELIEDMVKHNPDQRSTLANVKDVFQRLYIELETQIKQDHSLNKSYNSSIGTSHTAAHNSYNQYSNNHANNQSNSFYSSNNNNNNYNSNYNSAVNNSNNYNNNNYNSTINNNNNNYQSRQNTPNRHNMNSAMSYSPSRYDQNTNGGGYNNASSDPYYNNYINKNHGDPLGLNSNIQEYSDQYNQYPNQNNLHNQMSNQQLGQSYPLSNQGQTRNGNNSNNISYYN